MQPYSKGRPGQEKIIFFLGAQPGDILVLNLHVDA
jgi:hypothetical protein